MRINRVNVEKLFGIFNHDIPLNSDSGITIVIGENGLGKTIILEAINALFSHDYRFFSSLEFKKFSIYFNNNDIWQLTKKSSDEGFSLFIGRDSVVKPVQKIKPFKIFQETEGYSRKTRKREHEIMRRMDMDMDNYIFHSESRLFSDRIIDFEQQHEYRKILEVRRRLQFEENSEISPPKWFTDNIEKINVRLIETQRIITIKERGSDSYVNNVKKCSQELKEMISVAAKESSDVTSELDSTYPNRLVKKFRQGTNDSFEDLNEALAKLDDRRKSLSSVGLVVKIGDSDLLQIEEEQKDLVNLLKLYIDDSHKKLDPYEELSQKIKLFKGIINKRFKHKVLEIKQDEGLVFRSTVVKESKKDFEVISPSKLSSGEQNELILFYKLIFNAHKNDMILIDEPELSLHISWQNKFIKDLKSITSINSVSIIIATHSPDIIDDNWDLRVELMGVE